MGDAMCSRLLHLNKFKHNKITIYIEEKEICIWKKRPIFAIIFLQDRLPLPVNMQEVGKKISFGFLPVCC